MVPLAAVSANAVLAGAVALAFAAIAPAVAQPQPDVNDVLLRVGARISEFYNRAKNVICVETSRVQNLDIENSPVGFVRTVESELHIEESDQAAGEAALVRTIRKVNGRPPREKDKKDRAGCTDPNPVSSEQLAFLLPAQRSKYVFKSARIITEKGQPAFTIDFESVDRRSNPELVADASGHDDCFDWSGHIAESGRIWVDAGTFDVIRVERKLRGPVDVKVPASIQRRYHLAPFVVIVRDDVTIRYRNVAFSDPAEVLRLPESIDTLTVIRGGLQSTRRSQTFADYRRFVTGGRVVLPTSATPAAP